VFPHLDIVAMDAHTPSCPASPPPDATKAAGHRSAFAVAIAASDASDTAEGNAKRRRMRGSSPGQQEAPDIDMVNTRSIAQPEPQHVDTLWAPMVDSGPPTGDKPPSVVVDLTATAPVPQTQVAVRSVDGCDSPEADSTPPPGAPTAETRSLHDAANAEPPQAEHATPDPAAAKKSSGCSTCVAKPLARAQLPSPSIQQHQERTNTPVHLEQGENSSKLTPLKPSPARLPERSTEQAFRPKVPIRDSPEVLQLRHEKRLLQWRIESSKAEVR